MSKKEPLFPLQTWIAIIGSMLFVTYMMVGLWIDTDPSKCNYSDLQVQNYCIEGGWGLHVLEISLPVLVTITVLRIFKDDDKTYFEQTREWKEQRESTKPKEEPFDYSKMGANSQ